VYKTEINKLIGKKGMSRRRFPLGPLALLDGVVRYSIQLKLMVSKWRLP